MSQNRRFEAALKAINQHGVLLVFPVKNQKEPHSLWSVLHPKTEMVWAWDEDSDDKVGKMWLLMKKLSDCRQVVYSKWYQGRATFFSREVFAALLCLQSLRQKGQLNWPQSKQSQPKSSQSKWSQNPVCKNILEVLESDSPLSTKELKKMTELQGKLNEPLYTKCMKELFQNFQIVGYGEVDDGAFPSLAVGATSNLYEDLCQAANDMSVEQARKIVDMAMPMGSSLRKFYDRIAKTK